METRFGEDLYRKAFERLPQAPAGGILPVAMVSAMNRSLS